METGFAPEWVELQKEIRLQKDKVRGELKKVRQSLGPSPLSKEKHETWMRLTERLADDEVKSINKMIEKFNLIVPNMNNQMFHYKLDADADKIYNTGFDFNEEAQSPNPNTATSNKASVAVKSDKKDNGIFSGMLSLFNK